MITNSIRAFVAVAVIGGGGYALHQFTRHPPKAPVVHVVPAPVPSVAEHVPEPVAPAPAPAPVHKPPVAAPKAKPTKKAATFCEQVRQYVATHTREQALARYQRLTSRQQAAARAC